MCMSWNDLSPILEHGLGDHCMLQSTEIILGHTHAMALTTKS